MPEQSPGGLVLADASPDAHLSPVQRQAGRSSALELPSAGGQLRPNEAAGYLMLEPVRFNALMAQCEIMVAGGGIHYSIDTPAKAAAIALKGIEIGIPLMAAWSGMRIIEGEITVLGKLALRLIYQRAVPMGATCKRIAVPEAEKRLRAGWLMARPGNEPTEYWFSMEDAKAAKLLQIYSRKQQKWINTPAYEKYPERMLPWRALAYGAAYEFPDILQGCLLAEELDHKDPEFIDAQLVAAGETPPERKSPSFPDLKTERVELDRAHPEVVACSELITAHAGQIVRCLIIKGEVLDDLDAIAEATKLARRELWAELAETHIGGQAPTFGEARTIQGALAERIRRHKDVIRNLELARMQETDNEPNGESPA